MLTQTPEWVAELPESLSAWFETVMDDGAIWGRFRHCVDAWVPYCLPGSGIAAYLIDALNGPFPGANPGNVRACAEWALSMQDEATTFFIDRELEKLLPQEMAESSVRLNEFRRAVTAKGSHVLKRAGMEPRFPVHADGVSEDPDPNPDEYIKRITALDWSNVWGACAQSGKFLNDLFNNYILKGREEYVPAFRRTLEFVLSRQDPDTGMWGDASMSPGVQMSGAKKALGTLYWSLGVIPPHIERIADTALDLHHGGALFNDAPDGAILYDRNNIELAALVYRSTDYRKEELRDYIEHVVGRMREYSQPDGGFANVYTGMAPAGFASMTVSGPSESPRSDLVGVNGVIYTLGMAADTLGWEDYPMKPLHPTDWDQLSRRPYRVTVDDDGKVAVLKQ